MKKIQKKKLFTPGPASLLVENISSIEPCFGRGDDQFEKLEKYVLNRLKKITSHTNIARMQGSASFALEVMINNFIYGKLLIIKTGTYSDRLLSMSIASKHNYRKIKKIDYVDHKNINHISGKYDWVMACPVETSIGLKIPISRLFKLKKKCKAKLALDATASIGLEENHGYADILGYSSCKGLFGLTGGAFVAYNEAPNNNINQFNLNIYNHIEKKMTGPYHAICSLNDVLKNYNDFKYAVIANKKYFLKKMQPYLTHGINEQPNLCTLINKKIFKKNKNVVLYQSRADIAGSVVCHLGEVHLKRKAKGEIINSIKISN
ncbi:MAG: hypothetical protein CMA12_00390 [Euryarchaeota archaeon]|nr:hypothetical protein [Euryarchaeota archaeon]